LLIVVLTSNNPKNILLAEIEWITQARIKLGKDMVYNTSNGGIIVWLGLKHSSASRAKMRQSHIGLHNGDKNNMFGKQHSISSKELMSKNRKGINAGENHPNSKLSKEEVDLIKTDARSERFLAKLFKVSRSTINSIKRGINWK
jgi:NUMOD3 motif